MSAKTNSKKYLIILILKILETETDEDNPITQKKITELISSKYPCDRKTVGRNIGFLKNVGYPIVKTSKGFYLSTKKFTVEEVDFIIKSVLESTEKTEEERQDISERLISLLNKIYR